jgi:aminoglycoside phosphotransferase (APT) family kinase protein
VWLRHFQRLTSQERRAAPPFSHIVEQVKANLQVCVDMGLSSADATRLLQFCEQQVSRVKKKQVPVVGEHPDFQPDNVLVSPARVTVLDFTNFRYGSPYNDVARFLASLDFFSKNLLYSQRRLRALMAAFLNGYGWRPGEMDAGLTIYLLRDMVQAIATVSTWPQPPLMKRLMERRAVAFLRAWSRSLIAARADFVEHILRSA